ncbi:hypothetical protein SY83_00980 [Paenibacillus swuensis]|uniref:Uncharacterized protein n=2 Tax=Paenibacillus swuensis TaxID=1178515 RepID=A0A172TNS9_9BACL|nr:hypothetical protein SY83_00980 [Paenibacillus swuensis]
MISYKNKQITVHSALGSAANLNLLYTKLDEMQYDFDFRKKLKKISFIEMVGDVAIFKYTDGTKLYLEVS